jgi:hypothetical protein
VRVGSAAIFRQRLAPAREQRLGLVPQRAIAGGASHAREAAQELPEDHGASRLAPAAQVFARCRHADLAAKALEDAVVRDRRVDVARSPHLFFEAPRQQPHAVVVERFDTRPALCVRGASVQIGHISVISSHSAVDADVGRTRAESNEQEFPIMPPRLPAPAASSVLPIR